MPNSSSSEKLAKDPFAKPVIIKATVKRTPVAQARVTSKRSPPGGGRGVHLEKLGGSVRPASQNPYPIYDQNLRYSPPYLWSDF